MTSSLKTLTEPFHLCSLYAPVTGNTVALEEVHDVVFAENLVGIGVAIQPDSDGIIDILSPADGHISSILPGNHAFFMKTDDGIELLVHYGLNSVSLHGEGFKRLVEPAQKVSRGDIILQADNRILKQKGISTITPVVVASPEHYEIKVLSGGVSAGISAIIHLHRR